MTSPTNPKFTTISDLGYDASIKYAQNQKTLEADRKSSKVSGLISGQAEVDVYTPYPVSEFETLFQTDKRNKKWASFSEPPNMNQKSRCFTYELLPGSSGDKCLAYAQSVREKVAHDHKALLQSQNQNKAIPPSQAQLDALLAFQEEEKEGKTLFSFFGDVDALNKLLVYIEGRRNQYQRG